MELAGEVGAWMARMETTQTQLAERVEQVKRLETALSNLAAEKAQAEGELADSLAVARAEGARLTEELRSRGEELAELGQAKKTSETELGQALETSRSETAALVEELASVRAAHAERDEQMSAELTNAVSSAADRADALDALRAELTGKETSWHEEMSAAPQRPPSWRSAWRRSRPSVSGASRSWPAS